MRQLTVECKGISNIDPYQNKMTVELIDIENASDILHQLVKIMTLSGVVHEIGIDDILEEIGIDEVMEHFDD